MIAVTELRLGNWVRPYFYFSDQQKSEEALLPPVQVDADLMKFFLDNKLVTYNPISLTEEILLGCGFKNGSYHTNWFSHYELTSHIVKYDDGFILEEVDDIRISTSFHYLHQLQNIYYALTGTELVYTVK